MDKNNLIRKIYLYLFATVGLILLAIGVVRFIDMGLRTFVFTEARRVEELRETSPHIPRVPDISPETIEDEISEENIQTLEAVLEDYREEKEKWEDIDRYRAEKEKEAASNLAFIIVGAPLYGYHWMVIKKDKKKEKFD